MCPWSRFESLREVQFRPGGLSGAENFSYKHIDKVGFLVYLENILNDWGYRAPPGRARSISYR